MYAGKYILKIIKYLQYILFAVAVILLFALASFAEDLEDVERLKDYPKPLFCKFIENGVIISSKSIILTWAELESIKDGKLRFLHNSQIIDIGPNDSYICTLVGE